MLFIHSFIHSQKYLTETSSMSYPCIGSRGKNRVYAKQRPISQRSPTWEGSAQRGLWSRCLFSQNFILLSHGSFSVYFGTFLCVFLKIIKEFPFALAGALTNHLVHLCISYTKYVLHKRGSMRYLRHTGHYTILGTITNTIWFALYSNLIVKLEDHLITESWTSQCQDGLSTECHTDAVFVPKCSFNSFPWFCHNLYLTPSLHQSRYSQTPRNVLKSSSPWEPQLSLKKISQGSSWSISWVQFLCSVP